VANLLIVEDNEDLAESLASILMEEGHRVRIAADGQEGLARIAEDVPTINDILALVARTLLERRPPSPQPVA
jgi:DNA-binding response OmpR family regulator